MGLQVGPLSRPGHPWTCCMVPYICASHSWLQSLICNWSRWVRLGSSIGWEKNKDIQGWSLASILFTFSAAAAHTFTWPCTLQTGTQCCSSGLLCLCFVQVLANTLTHQSQAKSSLEAALHLAGTPCNRALRYYSTYGRSHLAQGRHWLLLFSIAGSSMTIVCSCSNHLFVHFGHSRRRKTTCSW